MPTTHRMRHCCRRALVVLLAGLSLGWLTPTTLDASEPTPRLVIHGEAGAEGVLLRADQLAMLLTSRSLGTVEARFVPVAIETPSIRYFHAEDRAIAMTVVDLLDGLPTPGTVWRLGDFTDYRPLPRRGTVEVWLPPS